MDINLARTALYSRALRSKVHRVAESVRIIHGKQKLNRLKNSVVVICLVKNGEYYIQSFIEHYRRIGVKHIFLMDNGSTDRTLEIATKFNSVTVIECRLPFNEYKLALRIFLAETYGNDSWCLSVDIDEFWEFPFCDQILLTQFVQYLEEFGFTACVAHQLDLFGEGLLSKTSGADSPLSDLRYFDLSDIYYWRNDSNNNDRCIDDRIPVFFSGNKISSPDIPVMAQGVRWRLFGINPILTKVVLFKLVQPVAPFVKSSHRLEGGILADVSCVLLHNLLNQHLFTKAVWCAMERSYYNNSAHYKQIAEKFELAPIHLPINRKLYQSVNYLIELEFIHISTEFEKFVRTHNCSKVKDNLACEVCNIRTLPLYVPSTQPRGVFEKYLAGEVEITKETVHICECKLDEKGRVRFAECSAENEIETVIGIARLYWKSLQDRSECIELQWSKNKGREPEGNRWNEIVSMVSTIKNGNILPLPALVHPALHDHEGLRVIDGARRIIANIEASNSSFPVLIIKPI